MEFISASLLFCSPSWREILASRNTILNGWTEGLENYDMLILLDGNAENTYAMAFESQTQSLCHHMKLLKAH